MFFRTMTLIGLSAAVAIGQVEDARADAGDFIGGAIIGGVLGHAITKDQQRKQQQRRTVTRYRSTIPSTAQGAQTQNALNYFGYNAGRVDGQVGPGTRRAIEAYQASMGYPVNGHSFQPYQYDFLVQAYYWAQNGGQAQTRLSGQPLLMAYRQQVQGGTLYANTPPSVPAPSAQTTVVITPPTVVTPEPTETAPVDAPVMAAVETEPEETSQLPNLFAGGAPAMSLANHCNAVMLQTSSNGGYTTLASLSDADFALSEQFCLARSYAIARGEEMMNQVQGLSQSEIATQCSSYGGMLRSQVDALSLAPRGEAEAGMRTFALESGIPPADLAATARVCLAVGYGKDDMTVALGSALMLSALGEPAYGELLGHHLREGFGTATRRDLAAGWYDASLTALESGAAPVFMPSQSDRPALLREATLQLRPGEQQGRATGSDQPTTSASLPTFSVAQ